MRNHSTLGQIAASLLAITLIVSVTGCEQKDDDDSDADPAATGSTASGGDDGDSTLVTDTTANIATVQAGMVPGSLAIETGALRLQDGGPCADTGFFDCQPNLLKLYLGMAKDMVAMTNEIVEGAGEGLAHVSTPGSGTIEPDEEDAEFSKIEYDVTSSTDFSILLSSATAPALYLDVDGSTYRIKANIAEMDDSGGGGPGAIEAEIHYTDANNFTVDMKLAGQECQADDVRAPESIAIHIAKVDGIVQGKAMLYHPRMNVQNDGDCSVEPTDSTKVFFYTDFVGDDTNATVGIYFMPRSVDAAELVADYPVSAFCTNFAGGCNNGYGFGDPNPVASYTNPACVTGDETAWGGACDSDNELISTPTYGAASDWILPADLETTPITLPESLSTAE